MASAVLEARGIVKEYPGVRALDGVDFTLEAGEIHALLGENGAGKSTLINVLTGSVRPDAGELRIAGEEVSLTSPRDAADRGVNVIHQDLAFAPELDIRTTLSLGDIPVSSGRLSGALGVIDRKAIDDRAVRALATIRMTIPAWLPAGRLSVAQGQLLQIARALSAKRQATLLLDEPTSSLSPSERDELFGHLRELKGLGIGILYISHRLEEIVEIADRATVLRDGRVVGVLGRSELTVERAAAMMLGSSKVQDIALRSHTLGPPLLELRGLSRAPHFRGISLTVRAGEIVGLTGLVGAGRTELARCIFGADRPDDGKMLVREEVVAPRSPAEAIALGIGFATEDRKAQGVFFWLNVRDNVIVSPLARSEMAGRYVRFKQVLRRKAIDRIAQEMVTRLGIRPARTTAQVGTMSGGNQQRVILGRWLASESPILILDEPTRGVDVGAKADIWELVHDLADLGTAILAISSEVPELIAHASRIVVMKQGAIAGELPRDRATEEEVMLLAGGTN